MNFRTIMFFVTAVAVSVAAHAHSYKIGDINIGHPSARATVAAQPSGAAYLTLENNGKDRDKLVSVSSPIAKSAQIHTMTMDGNVMKMREADGIELKPAAKIAMKPGDGYHIMLLGLTQQLKAGDKFPMTLTFEKAGKLEVSVHVEDKEASGAKSDKDMTDHQDH